jgi:hypothetical protein
VEAFQVQEDTINQMSDNSFNNIMSYTNRISDNIKLHSSLITGTCPNHTPYQHNTSCSVEQQRKENTKETKDLDGKTHNHKKKITETMQGTAPSALS